MANVIFRTSVYTKQVRDEFPNYTAIPKPSHFIVGVLTWLRANCEGDVIIGTEHYYFKNGNDALIYKLSLGL